MESGAVDVEAGELTAVCKVRYPNGTYVLASCR